MIDLKILRKNAQYVRSLIGRRKFFAVVKADAYGHGGIETARAIEDIVDGFCVAISDEGAALRIGGVLKPVLVFTPPLGRDDISRAEMYGLQVTVNSAETARAAKNLVCHIKVNTGMNRLGCGLSDLPKILKNLNKSNIAGIYSHLFAPEDEESSNSQLEIFGRAESIVKDKNPQSTAHISASGGILRGGEYLSDGVRCGILLYGYAPTGFSAPVRRVYARRVQNTKFCGGGVGYMKAQKNYGELCTYRLGYADGFERCVPLGEGKLCMDSFVSTGGKNLFPALSDADEYAGRAGTISYEVLCSATRRAERIYEE